MKKLFNIAAAPFRWYDQHVTTPISEYFTEQLLRCFDNKAHRLIVFTLIVVAAFTLLRVFDCLVLSDSAWAIPLYLIFGFTTSEVWKKINDQTSV